MGRPKGAKNKHNFNAEELARDMGVDPLEFMLKMIEGDFKYFGFKEATKVTYTAQGIEVEEPNLPMRDRVTCAKEAAKYIYSAKQAVTVQTGAEGFKVIVEDYGKK